MIVGNDLITLPVWVPEYLIRDEFLDNHPAGTVNNTAATPGPGTRTVTDTESKISVGSGALAFAGGKASPSATDPAISYGALSSATGLALIFSNKVAESTAENSNIFLNRTAAISGGGDAQWYFVSDSAFVRLGGTSLPTVAALSPGNYHQYAIVQNTSGALFFYRANGQTEWTLEYVSTLPTWTASTYISSMNYTGERNVDYVRVLALPAPFDTDDGIATDVLSGSVAAGTTFSHEADCLIEFTVTTLGTTTASFVFRKQDETNYWSVAINSSGGLYLFETISGAPTQRGGVVGVVSSGHRVVIVAEGSTIKGYSNNVLRWTYASATNFATATAGSVVSTGAGGAISDLKTWPRTLSGRAKQILDIASQ